MRYSLAVVPGDIRNCFSKMTGKPLPGSMTEAQIIKLIADLRKSEQSKTMCGRRLLFLYDTQAKVLFGQTGSLVGW